MIKLQLYVAFAFCVSYNQLCFLQLLVYGRTAVSAPVLYYAEICGVNISNMTIFTKNSTSTFSDLPPVSSNIIGSIQAKNVFGSGGRSIQVESKIGMFLYMTLWAYKHAVSCPASNEYYVKIDCGVLCVNCSLVSSSIQGTISRILDQDDMTNLYNLQIVCDIKPSSVADYCEVFAYGPDTIIGKDFCMLTCIMIL